MPFATGWVAGVSRVSRKLVRIRRIGIVYGGIVYGGIVYGRHCLRAALSTGGIVYGDAENGDPVYGFGVVNSCFLRFMELSAADRFQF
jgi:hypothetical protein